MRNLIVINYSDLLDVLRSINALVIYNSRGQMYEKFISGHNNDIKNLTLLEVRSQIPPKMFLFTPKEPIINNKDNFGEIILIGPKSCDLVAMRTLDNIFLNENCQDELYVSNRNRITTISSDCYTAVNSCFCCVVGGKPFITESGNTDINISFVDENNYILEAFSDKGRNILNKYFSKFESPTKTDLLKRDSLRRLVEKKVLEINKDYLIDDEKNNNKYYKILKKTFEIDEQWILESTKCVQCGGCNFICPSCYCFLIREASLSYKEQYRDKVWDACHLTGYARAAGGGNPRKYKYQRFRNRYQCKFVYRYDNFGMYACSGCGRCIDVCPGKIDIRSVIRNLVIAKGKEVLV
ncbi:MAG: 4Fe-4S dicluster domain-containing protein [Endomicrobia bacterium]|nr:4Fe-4S dicluster domain-containing protein [Endomicrobiia bacterium]